MNAELEIQRTFYVRLNESPGVDYPVFDYVEQGTEYPYIKIGGATAENFDSKSFDGFEVSIILDFWSRYAGDKEIKEMMGAAYAILHNQSLHVEGYNFVHCFFEFSECIVEDDGETRHGVQRYNVIITQE